MPGLGVVREPDLSVGINIIAGAVPGARLGCPHVVVPIPPALCGWAPTARCHRGAAGCAVSQLCPVGTLLPTGPSLPSPVLRRPRRLFL